MQFSLPPSVPPADICSGSACTLYLCQINLDLYETLNLRFLGPNWMTPLILTIPCSISALWNPLEPLYSPLYPYISAKTTWVSMRLKSKASGVPTG